MLPHGDKETGNMMVYTECEDLFGQKLYLYTTITILGPDADDAKNDFYATVQHMKLRNEYAGDHLRVSDIVTLFGHFSKIYHNKVTEETIPIY